MSVDPAVNAAVLIEPSVLGGSVRSSVPQYCTSSPVSRQIAAAAESDQAAALMEIADSADGGPCFSVPAHAEQLFRLETRAQLSFVAPDGAVSAPTEPRELLVGRFPG